MHRIHPQLALLSLGVAAAAFGQEGDTKLSTTAGQYVWLADVFHDKPAILFYEDKDSTLHNQALKDALFKTGKARGLLEAASVVAVANVRSFNWFPAKNFVVASVCSSEKKAGVPIYLDWTGALSGKPWGLQPAGASVLVVDRGGNVQFSKDGPLSAQEVDQVLRQLEQLIHP